MCRIDEFWNIHETFPHFFSKQAKLRKPHWAETADFRFQIYNFEIRQIAFLMTCRPHQSWTYLYKKFMTKLTQAQAMENTYVLAFSKYVICTQILYVDNKK